MKEEVVEEEIVEEEVVKEEVVEEEVRFLRVGRSIRPKKR